MDNRHRSEQKADRRLDDLVDLLADNATVMLSGTKLASRLRIPPSTLWDEMEKLRSMGVEIHGLPGTGYQLKKIPDVLTPRVVRLALHAGEFGHRVHHYYKIDSTMNAAGQFAAQGAKHGTLVIAEEQEAGRGRFGREWHSERGAGLYFTLILRPKLTPAEAPIITLMAGAALAEVLGEILHVPTDLRWPNDVLIGAKKCAGILVEMTAEPERIAWVLLGLGVNVNQIRWPEALQTEATSLRMETGRNWSRLEILAAVLKRLEQYYLLLMQDGREPILKRFAELSSYAQGKRVKVTDGDRVVSGETAGLSPEGILLLRRQDGQIERVLTGQVREE